MKRFFQRLENSSTSQRVSDYQRETLGAPSVVGGGGPVSHSSGGSFIGKVFTLGQYHCTVEDIIAEGGFALVFLVKAQSSLGRFALKRLHVNNEQDLANCKREIDTAKTLGSHKNIVQLVESSINYCGNGVYEILMLMQYCKGHLLQLLNERLKEGLPETEVIRILCNLCEAIARMHHNDPPIIHRDLKVENILISETGTYLLCDFGSATTKVLALDPSGSTASALAIDEDIKRYTTLAYRSPEMVDIYSGKPITTKADIWALGCLVYKLCFFSLPFGESTLAIQNAALTIPDAHVDRYSNKLLSLIGYMLTADPDERPDIYQVSALAFQLADQKSPVPNLTVTKTVLVPAWTELRVPPTESHARDTRKISTASQSGPNYVTANSLTHNSHSSNNLEQPIGLTTSVVPRQRPKATININSVLPTSPLPFNSTQRATTPSDLPAIASNSTNTLTVNPSAPLGAPSTLSNSASFSANLASNTVDDDDEDDVDWSKKRNRKTRSSQQQSQSSSNPQLYIDYSSAASSKNPFLDSALQQAQQQSSSLPRPPSRRHSQTPPGVTTTISPPPSNLRNDHTNGAPVITHHHRRNMSDTTAFSTKNMNCTSITVTTQAQLQPPPQATTTRVRSLNPFDDANDVSYEDQLFGHEFDKIRQEVTQVVSHTSPPSQQQVQHQSNHRDPFEQAPFDPDRLKRYFSKQASSESVSPPSNCTFQPISEQPVNSSVSNKPYLVNVISCDRHSSDQHSLDQSAKPKSMSTVITIRSNNDFVIHKSTSNKPTVNQPLSASSSSAFISVAPVGAVGPGLSDQMSKLTVTNQSISSSSQGQTTFGHEANYMPLYSSDTADDSENSSEDSDSDVDSDLQDGIGGDKTDLVNGTCEDDEVIDGALVAQEGDLMKPLVVDVDDEEYEEEAEDDEDEVEADDDFGSESSIGSASDLQQTSDSESVNSSSDEDDYNGAHPLEDLHSTDSSQPSKSLKSLDDHQSTHDSDGFEFINYDVNGSGAVKNGSWFKPVAGSKLIGQNISRIQITNSSNEIDDDDDVCTRHINNISMTPLVVDADDGTSVGEVLSTTSSINSSTTRNTANDNTSASIDHLIGHIEGSRPLLEEDDDGDDENSSNQTDPSHVKPFIEMDKEIEFIPPSSNTTLTNSTQDEPVDMFASMSSSINSVVTIFPGGVDSSYRPSQPPIDLLTEDPSPLTADFETLSLQQIVDETEENRKLDEEVAQSLNCQVILDQLTNKDLFGSIPFNDKELLTKSIIEQKSTSTKPAIAAKPKLTSQGSKGFESAFTELIAPAPQAAVAKGTSSVVITQTVLPPETQQQQQQQVAPVQSKKPSSFITSTSSDSGSLSNPIDLFGLEPFSETPSTASTQRSIANPQSSVVVAPLAAVIPNGSNATPNLVHPQAIKIGPPPPLQIITLKPVNHQQSSVPPPAAAPASQSTILKSTIASVSVVSSSTVQSTSTPLAQQSIPILSKAIAPSTTQPLAPAPQPMAPTSSTTSITNAMILPTPLTSTTPVAIKSTVLLQKSNSKLKSKVAKKYEVDESDDEVDGLLDPNEDESDMIMSGSTSKKDKKDKKKDKKDKTDKKSKEKDKTKDKDKTKEEKKKEKEKVKEKPEKEKKEKVKEPKKSKEDKEKEKSERKAEKEKEKEKKTKLKESKSKSLDVDKSKKKDDSKSAVLIASTPAKPTKDSKESSSSKEKSSKKVSSSKLKVPKHQAFANMSFEDEHQQADSTSIGSNSHPHVTNTSNSSVTITRC